MERPLADPLLGHTPPSELNGAPQTDAGGDDPTQGEEEPERIQKILERATVELDDGLNRLEMARSAAAGEEPELDEVERRIAELDESIEVRTRRARHLALSIADDLEEVARRLREALGSEG